MESENGTVFHACNKNYFPEGEVSEKRLPARRRSPLCAPPGKEVREETRSETSSRLSNQWTVVPFYQFIKTQTCPLLGLLAK